METGTLLTITPRIGQVEIPIGEHVVFYGPHPCDDCGKMICKASREQGEVKFDYPDGPIYPNTSWNLHHCKSQTVNVPSPEPE